MSDVQNVRNFSDKQRLFIEWLATSKYDRKPPNQGLLAKELKVCEKTLSRWKKLPGLEAEVLATSRQLLHDRLPEIYGALAREAEKGSFQHIKLVMEMAGEYTETKRIEGKDGGPIEIKEIVIEMPSTDEAPMDS